MKKMVISLLCTLAALLFSNNFAMAQQQNEDTTRTEITLIKTQTSTRPIFRAPARVSSISAVLDGSTGEIEIVFDEPEGNATIEISCMGQTVSKYVCNTAEEWIVFMPIPVNSGTYSLNITTASAEYIGYFSL